MSHPKRTTDDRGQMDGRRAVTLVVALTVAGILAGVVLPVAINEITGDNSESFTSVTEGDEVDVTASLNATLDNVTNTGTSNITVTVNDTDAGTSTTFTDVAVGESVTQSLEGEDITLTTDAVSDATTADFTVEYPKDYNYGDGAKSIWDILDLVLVLGAFLYLVGLALRRSGAL